MDLEERREWLEEQVGRLPDFTWTSLIDSRYAKAGQMEEEEEELLLERAKFGLQQAQLGRRRRWSSSAFRRASRKDPYSRWPFISERQLRRNVFASCVADAAAEHPQVLAFREEALGGSFSLTYKQALRYVDQDGNVREDAPYAQELKALTEMLARSCLWRVDDASWFVLTGSYTPPIATPTVEKRIAKIEGGPEIGTITLTVEPWLPAEKVAEMYKKAQREMLDKKPHQVSRSRLRLLEFVEAWGEGTTWRECMDSWNEHNSEEKYEDVRNFSKAYRQVRALVLEPGYHVARKDQTALRKDRRQRVKRDITRMDRFRRYIESIDRQMERELAFAERTRRDNGEDGREN
jgi:hypothetical protein